MQSVEKLENSPQQRVPPMFLPKLQSKAPQTSLLRAIEARGGSRPHDPESRGESHRQRLLLPLEPANTFEDLASQPARKPPPSQRSCLCRSTLGPCCKLENLCPELHQAPMQTQRRRATPEYISRRDSDSMLEFASGNLVGSCNTCDIQCSAMTEMATWRLLEGKRRLWNEPGTAAA